MRRKPIQNLSKDNFIKPSLTGGSFSAGSDYGHVGTRGTPRKDITWRVDLNNSRFSGKASGLTWARAKIPLSGMRNGILSSTTRETCRAQSYFWHFSCRPFYVDVCSYSFWCFCCIFLIVTFAVCWHVPTCSSDKLSDFLVFSLGFPKFVLRLSIGFPNLSTGFP